MKPCKECGASDRYSNGKCAPCGRAAGAKYRQTVNGRAKQRARDAAYAQTAAGRATRQRAEWKNFDGNTQYRLRQNREKQWYEAMRDLMRGWRGPEVQKTILKRGPICQCQKV